MPIIESVIERKMQDGKTMYIAVIDGKEVMAFNEKVKEFKGLECPYPIIKTKSGKDMIAFPKEGGFQGKSGGGWKGKSDRELNLQALTMCLSYAKDVAIAELQKEGSPSFVVPTYILDTYRAFSNAVLADLKAIEGEAPKQEAVKEAVKPPVATRQVTSGVKASKAPYDEEKATIKEKLSHELWQHLRNMRSESDENFKTLLINCTEFPGKNRETGELTGKMVYIDDFNDKRLSDAWAGKALGKLREIVEEEERMSATDADLGSDLNF